jgi:hypothetical protein
MSGQIKKKNKIMGKNLKKKEIRDRRSLWRLTQTNLLREFIVDRLFWGNKKKKLCNELAGRRRPHHRIREGKKDE